MRINHRSCLVMTLCFSLYTAACLSIADNIFITSIPKCGTHLLIKCLELLTGRQKVGAGDFMTTGTLPAETGNFLQKHLKYSPRASRLLKQYNFKLFFIYRDPRDKAISKVYWVQEGRCTNPKFGGQIKELPFDELLNHVIKDTPREYGLFLPWMRDSICCAVKFEDLVGPQGGGTRQAQVRAIRKIAKHLELDLDQQTLNHCIDNLYGGTHTFREGKIGGWRKHFKSEHIELLKDVSGNLLPRLGYEKSARNWK